jgi:hypothetical protein
MRMPPLPPRGPVDSPPPLRPTNSQASFVCPHRTALLASDVATPTRHMKMIDGQDWPHRAGGKSCDYVG